MPCCTIGYGHTRLLYNCKCFPVQLNNGEPFHLEQSTMYDNDHSGNKTCQNLKGMLLESSVLENDHNFKNTSNTTNLRFAHVVYIHH